MLAYSTNSMYDKNTKIHDPYYLLKIADWEFSFLLTFSIFFPPLVGARNKTIVFLPEFIVLVSTYKTPCYICLHYYS